MNWEQVERLAATPAVRVVGLLILAAVLTAVVYAVVGAAQRHLQPFAGAPLTRRIIAELLGVARAPLALLLLLGSLSLALATLHLPAATGVRLQEWIDAVSVVVVLLVALRSIMVVIALFTESLSPRLRTPAQARLLRTILPHVRRATAIAVVVIGALVVLAQLGVAVAPLLAGLGIGGLAVALAFQGTLTNLIAGINLSMDGTIRVDDLVELEDGRRGYVVDIGWRTTKVRLRTNNLVIIPNAKLSDSVTTNYHLPSPEIGVYVYVGVAYESDLDHVKQVTRTVARQVAAETPEAIKNYEPSVWFYEFGDSNIYCRVQLRGEGWTGTWAVRDQFIIALKRRFDAEGIEISFPARNIFWRGDGEAMDPRHEQAER